MFSRRLAVAVIVVIALFGESRTADGQMSTMGESLPCLLCHQWQEWEDGAGFVWKHYMDLNSAEQCAQDPGEMCRACGGSSECHGWGDPQDGECHAACSSGSLATLNQTVSELLAATASSQPRAAILTSLAQVVGSSPSLELDIQTGSLKLFDCGGQLLNEWQLPKTQTKAIAMMIRVRRSAA